MRRNERPDQKRRADFSRYIIPGRVLFTHKRIYNNNICEEFFYHQRSIRKSKLSKPQANAFHFAECTNCKHILPLSTTTEKYFEILSKEPDKPKGLGEKCMRCGADSWVLVIV